MTDLLTYLCGHPDTPPALLSQLVEHACNAPASAFPSPWSARLLRTTLVANPSVTAEQVAALSAVPNKAGRQQVLRAALNRPGTTAQVAIAALGDDHSATSLTAALTVVKDTTGVLDNHAYAHATGMGLWTQLVKESYSPAAVRWSAAHDLAAYPKALSPKAVGYVVRLARESLAYATTTQEHADVVAKIHNLIETSKVARPTPKVPSPATARVDLAAKLGALNMRFAPPPAGSAVWLANPALCADEVIAWAGATTTDTRWIQVLKHYRDTTGEVAAAALAAHPASRDVTTRLVRSQMVPLTVREAAGRALFGAADDAGGRALLALARASSSEFTMDLFRRRGVTAYDLDEMTRRTDLTAADLDELGDLAVASDAKTGAHWGLSIVTHPCATPAQRAHWRAQVAAACAAAALATTGRAAEYAAIAAIAEACVDLDPAGDPTSPGRCGGRVPLSVLAHWSITRVGGVAWLLSQAVTAHMPTGLSSDAATVLRLLAGEFTGSLSELVTTAQTIAD